LGPWGGAKPKTDGKFGFSTQKNINADVSYTKVLNTEIKYRKFTYSSVWKTNYSKSSFSRGCKIARRGKKKRAC